MVRIPRFALRSRFWLTLTILVFFSVGGRAQNSITWATNYYQVTGASFREIQQSLANSRPWKDDFAGETRWSVDWKFNLIQNGEQCSCSSFNTATKIVTTLPRWITSTNAGPETNERWNRFLANLGQHEAGHARIGIAAAIEVGKSIAGVSAQPDCARLTKLINDSAERVLEDFRNREKEYDRVTNHGRKPPEAR